MYPWSGFLQVQQLVDAGFMLMSQYGDLDTVTASIAGGGRPSGGNDCGARSTPFKSHLAHDGTIIGCDFVAVRGGGARVVGWQLLGEEGDLNPSQDRLSDHLAVVATISVATPP
jgi:hypothetical protein